MQVTTCLTNLAVIRWQSLHLGSPQVMQHFTWGACVWPKPQPLPPPTHQNNDDDDDDDDNEREKYNIYDIMRIA